MNTTTQTWEQFNRFNHVADNNFFGIVDKDGNWFDSAFSFPAAVHVAAQSVGYVDSFEQALKVCQAHGFSLIHGTIIKKMFEARLIR